MQATHHPAHHRADTLTRRINGNPETDADRRFFDLRQSGYIGPIDQDGHPAVSIWPNEPAAVTPASTLRAAARYLSRHGWIKGCYYDQTATVFTPAACMVGAIGSVCYGGPVEAPAQHFDDPGFAEFEAALTWLDCYLVDRYGVVAYEFNDATGRIAGQAIAALRDAADRWDRSCGGTQ
jgi:hypothetical protein